MLNNVAKIDKLVCQSQNTYSNWEVAHSVLCKDYAWSEQERQLQTKSRCLGHREPSITEVSEGENSEKILTKLEFLNSSLVCD